MRSFIRVRSIQPRADSGLRHDSPGGRAPPFRREPGRGRALRAPAEGEAATRTVSERRAGLLDLDLRAGFLELLLDGGRLVLGDPLLQDAEALDQLLGLLQAEARVDL